MAEKISRNQPCPCGSGQKYKRCCLGKASAADAASPEIQHAARRIAYGLAAAGVALGVAAGLWRDVYTGLLVMAAWAIASGAYMLFRDPPPVIGDRAHGAALDFGARAKDERKRKR